MLVKSCQEEPKLILQLSLRVVLGAFRIQLLALEWAVSSTWEAGNKVPEAHDLPAQGSVKARSEVIYVFSVFSPLFEEKLMVPDGSNAMGRPLCYKKLHLQGGLLSHKEGPKRNPSDVIIVRLVTIVRVNVAGGRNWDKTRRARSCAWCSVVLILVDQCLGWQQLGCTCLKLQSSAPHPRSGFFFSHHFASLLACPICFYYRVPLLFTSIRYQRKRLQDRQQDTVDFCIGNAWKWWILLISTGGFSFKKGHLKKWTLLAVWKQWSWFLKKLPRIKGQRLSKRSKRRRRRRAQRRSKQPLWGWTCKRRRVRKQRTEHRPGRPGMFNRNSWQRIGLKSRNPTVWSILQPDMQGFPEGPRHWSVAALGELLASWWEGERGLPVLHGSWANQWM